MHAGASCRREGRGSGTASSMTSSISSSAAAVIDEAVDPAADAACAYTCRAADDAGGGVDTGDSRPNRGADDAEFLGEGDAAAVSEGSKKLAGGDVNDVAGLAGLLAEVLMGDAAEDSKETAAGGEETAAGGEGS